MTAMCVGKHVSRIGALIYGYFIQLYVHLHRPANAHKQAEIV